MVEEASDVYAQWVQLMMRRGAQRKGEEPVGVVQLQHKVTICISVTLLPSFELLLQELNVTITTLLTEQVCVYLVVQVVEVGVAYSGTKEVGVAQEEEGLEVVEAWLVPLCC